MKLVNMKLSKEKKNEMVNPTMMDGPEYPLGLQIRLETESLDKLGMPDLPEVESVVDIVAKAKVVEVSAIDSKKGKKRRNIELQITDLSISPQTMGATQQARHITPYNAGRKNCAASPYCMGLKINDEPDVNMVSTYSAATGFVDWKFNTDGARVNHGAIHSGFHPFVSRVNNGTETSQTKAFYTNFLKKIKIWQRNYTVKNDRN